MRFPLRRCARWTLAAVIFLAAAEAAARLDDWIHLGTPLLASPDRNRDLTVHDELGIHGRPQGTYKKWILNNFGFRGPDIAATATPAMTRIMILGASETFGLYESPDMEYPAQLGAMLRQRGADNIEIVNVAMAGLTIKSMLPYWKNWVARLQAQVVVLYPSPLFYLDNEAPKAPSAEPPSNPQPEPGISSRMAGRADEALRRNDFLRRIHRERTIAKATRGKPEDWVFRSVPQDRLEQFVGDIEQLVQAIQASGAQVILVTHAMKAGSPPRPEDEFDLLGMRQFMPRATPETLVAFEDAAAQAIRDYGKRRGNVVLDAARQLNGRRELFADLVHFTDDGAAALARFLADELPASLRPSTGKSGPPSGPH